MRNALARFDQVKYETAASREKARNRLLRAAQRHDIMPIGFINSQLRSDRTGEAAPQADAPGLPEGFVTLLFTDIEGSTGHLQDLGGRYESLLEEVRKIVRRNVLMAGGTEVEVRADETFSVFVDAAAAVEGAVAIQTNG